MTPDEIRAEGVVEGEELIAIGCALIEIAAQLAELNVTLQLWGSEDQFLCVKAKVIE